jgi:hypothetical protein
MMLERDKTPGRDQGETRESTPEAGVFERHLRSFVILTP